MSTFIQPTALLTWKLSFLEQQIQQLKKIIVAKPAGKTASLKGIIKNSPDVQMDDFKQAKKSLFKC